MSSSSAAVPTVLAIDESDDKRSTFMTSAAEAYIICLEDTELMEWSGVLKLCLFGKLIIHKPFLCVVSRLLRINLVSTLRWPLMFLYSLVVQRMCCRESFRQNLGTLPRRS
ncbi:LOW QUALITY PROTEIN: hypothetical protein TorRG33x02_235320 [Trema orientale]|uniref:Uncharacterized protein n=1 Tax=Trema orientale TaxID=63057 RepID=A0A2P5E240_TREOI|nr:LOW QUALITY PROTEIN: hypothetical protein TorRG33x02_235320 [Trema orientale]